jgi:hypothetical protein
MAGPEGGHHTETDRECSLTAHGTRVFADFDL